MQVVNILSKHLSKVMHKTRLTTLSLLKDIKQHATLPLGWREQASL